MNHILYSPENSNVSRANKKLTFWYPCDTSLSCHPIFVTLKPGKYLVELWGAQGGDGRVVNTQTIIPNSGGKGAYVSGYLSLLRETGFYLFLGGQGENQESILKGAYGKGGFNGGGDGGVDLYDRGGSDDPPESSAGGGGSTDIRLNNKYPQSRIIIAGGGGGAVSGDSEMTAGGCGGELVGEATNPYSFGGGQSTLSFFSGQPGVSRDNNYGSGGGGGGGHYGGTRIIENLLPKTITYIGGAGGSSYISGFKGCLSVQNNFDSVLELNHSVHYSGYYFKKASMKSGKNTFVSPSGIPESGHSGNGAASITYISAPYFCTQQKTQVCSWQLWVFLIQLFS